MLTLGIETSCDDTCAAVLDGRGRILSNVRASQDELHARFGGVVPEIASRRHAEAMEPVLDEALRRAGVGLRDVGLIAVTAYRGLAGSLVVGVSAAKALGYALSVPVVPVHHVEAHLYSASLAHPDLGYPHLCLTVSGGHTLLALIEDERKYRVLGQSLDDAAGEAFDKVAKLLGLGFPGGPAIDRLARDGDSAAVPLPRPMLGQPGYDFSFSGLKTAVLHRMEQPDRPEAADLAASFQQAVVDVLVGRLLAAAARFGVDRLAIAGGVSANSCLRREVDRASRERGVRFYHLPLPLCTDNGAMVAYRGRMLHAQGLTAGLDLSAVPYAPLPGAA
jgi:tRNA N6-adenosine threonylcarbamoyltransferase